MDQSSEPSNAELPPLTTAPLLGAAPLIRGENARSYDELLGRICATLRPQDSLEEIWARDIVDLVWETFRLRRAKAWLMTADAHRRIGSELRGRQADRIARRWSAGDEDAAAQVTSALDAAGLSIDAMLAQAISNSYKTIEQLDRMLLSVEMRRSAVLRELDRHRAPLARKLRHAIAEVEEAELVADAPRLAEAPPA